MQLQDAISFVRGDYGPTSLMATNIGFRFVLNLGAGLACWVPLRLFLRNREFAGVAMIVATAIMNFYYGINAIIWPTNHIEAWFSGYGWCDIQLALWTPLETINAAAICAVMHNIANQVSLMRASELTVQEKRRKHLIQALVIFPIPVLQLVLYYFTIGMRYNISGIVGCQAVFQANCIFLVLFLLPCPIYAVAAAYFAALTWWKYRQIDASSRRILYNSGCYGAQARSARVRRKLYWMALTIVVPYCPMQLVFLFNNLRMGWPWERTYDLAQLHAPGWAGIDYAPSTTVPFVSMYINYIVFLEVVVFFIYFGGTKDAHEMYRRYLRALGLSRIFPTLNEEWHPSTRPPTSIKNLWPRAKSISSSFVSSIYTDSSRASSTFKTPTRQSEQHFDHVDHPGDENFLNIRLDSLDLERATETLDAARLSDGRPQLPYRRPGVFRINIGPRLQPPQPHKTPVLTMQRNVPKLPVVRREPETSPTHPSDSGLTPVLAPLYLSRIRSPMHNEDGCGVELDVRTPTFERPQRAQDPLMSSPPAVAMPPRLSDYGKCLVSLTRDFSSSSR